MATRGYLEQVEMRNVNESDARDVTESTSDAVVLVIDDEWSTALNATTIPHFTLTGTEPTRVFHLQTHHRHGNISTVSCVNHCLWDYKPIAKNNHIHS